MNIAILVFSPSGNTLKVASMIEYKLKSSNHAVQVIDITGDKKFFNSGNPVEYINEKILPHDILITAGPVHCQHLQYNILNLLKSLPAPDKKWGRYAIPLVTYGEISSGQSLKESALVLKKSGRVPVLGVKVNSFHTITRRTAEKINAGMPGDEIIPLINELAERISAINFRLPDAELDISSSLDFQSLKSRIIDSLFYRESFLYRIGFPKVKFLHEKCLKCGKCINTCSVRCIKINNGFPVLLNNGRDCIHCDECFNACPEQAIRHDLTVFEKYLSDSAKGIGMAPSHEFPKSAVYPLT